nr:MAG: ORF1 [TTV-like mini virus]
MPWRPRYYNYRRRHWIRYRRPRKPFWRRRWRWRRRPYRVRRKLKSLKIREYQPKCIRKCKIKGLLPLFWGPPERFVNNYELYELSTAPEKLPSGGLFGIKNFTLEGLFAEHTYCRNIWTATNNDLPLMRFCGATIKLYQALHTDYVFSWDNSLPLTSTLDLYETLHPGIHTMLQNKIIVPRKNNFKNTKPYIKIRTKPPTPLMNKWYFAIDMAKVPLLQTRASAMSIDEYYINYRSVSTSLTIPFINPGAIMNTNFKHNEPSGYYCRKLPNQDKKVYLYSAKNLDITDTTKINQLIFLGNTTHNYEGQPFTSIPTKEQVATYIQKYKKEQWGNPFHTYYLTRQWKVYYSLNTYNELATKIATNPQATVQKADFTLTFLTDAIRYNPFNDDGKANIIHFQTTTNFTNGWDPPQQSDLKQEGLPLWVLTFGFVDFHKKYKKIKNIDEEQMLVIHTDYRIHNTPTPLPIIDTNFINGKSPYEDKPDPADFNRWWPSTQFQQIITNTISLAGPGSPKIPPLNAVEAKIHYTFLFKWGGTLPPMSTITDPKDLQEYHVPTNFRKTNSLQNPASRPERLLFSFDERRQQLTTKAIKRLQKDWETKEISVTDGSRFQAPIQTEETSQTDSSEEEETTEDLLLQLNKQRLKHKQLKLKIMKLMGILQ